MIKDIIIRIGDEDHCDYRGSALAWLADADSDTPTDTIDAVRRVLAGGDRVDWNAASDGCPSYVAADTQETEAYQWAVDEQGFTGSIADWLALPASERNEYEDGAAGIPTT